MGQPDRRHGPAKLFWTNPLICAATPIFTPASQFGLLAFEPKRTFVLRAEVRRACPVSAERPHVWSPGRQRYASSSVRGGGSGRRDAVAAADFARSDSTGSPDR
jgi:hypothetical protein